MASVVCHTQDCPNAGIEFEFEHPLDDNGNPDPYWQIVCGVCSQPITDVKDDTANN